MSPGCPAGPGCVVGPGSQVGGRTNGVTQVRRPGPPVPGYDNPRRDDGPTAAAYSGVVKRMPGSALTGSRSRLVAGQVLRGLIQVLVAADPAPARRWRSPWHRRALNSALAITTLVLTAVSLNGIIHVPGNDFRAPGFRHGPLSLLLPSAVGTPHAIAVLVAVAVVAPLPIAARYPLLSWRIAWLALLLVPLSRISWQDGWPWDAAQIVVLLVVFCMAGVRHQRPTLWWMWALTLVPGGCRHGPTAPAWSAVRWAPSS